MTSSKVWFVGNLETTAKLVQIFVASSIPFEHKSRGDSIAIGVLSVDPPATLAYMQQIAGPACA